MSNRVGEQTVIDFLADRPAGNRGNLRGPRRRNRIVRQFDYPQSGRGERIVQRGKERVLLGCGGGVFGRQVLMAGLEINVQIDAGFVVLGIGELAGNDRSGETRLIGDEGESLRRADWLGESLFGSRGLLRGLLGTTL